MAVTLHPRDSSCTRLRVWAGWYVDGFTIFCYGQESKVGGEGGQRVIEDILFRDERILSMEVLRLQASVHGCAALGSKVILVTNKRTLVYEGENKSKGNKQVESTRIMSPDTSTVIGITVKNGFLEFILNTSRPISPAERSPNVLMEPISSDRKCQSRIWTSVIISDSTLGFKNARDGVVEEIVDSTLLITSIGASFTSLQPHLTALLQGFREKRILYVPMEQSFPGDKQKHYIAHESEQRKAFQGTPLIPLPHHAVAVRIWDCSLGALQWPVITVLWSKAQAASTPISSALCARQACGADAGWRPNAGPRLERN